MNKRHPYLFVALFLLHETFVRAFSWSEAPPFSRRPNRRRQHLVSLRLSPSRQECPSLGRNRQPRSVSQPYQQQLPSKQPKDPKQQKVSSSSSSSSSAFRLSNKPPSLAIQLDYARNGHAVLRQFLSPTQITSRLAPALQTYARQQELLAWQQKVQVWTEHRADCQALLDSCRSVQDCQRILESESNDFSLPFLQYFNAWRSLDIAKQVTLELSETAAILMDISSVRLYQDALFWKRSKDGVTPWHVDARMAPFDTSHMITFWIPLHTIKRTSGLVFCSGTHKDFALPFWNPYNNNDDDMMSHVTSIWNRLEERYSQDHPLVDYMPLSVGDVTVHSGWTLHCADPCMGDESIKERWAWAVTYVDARAPIRQSVQEELKKTTTSSATSATASTSNNKDYGDMEDVWSYHDWIQQVPANRYEWNHPLVPIVWPKQSIKQPIQKKRKTK